MERQRNGLELFGDPVWQWAGSGERKKSLLLQAVGSGWRAIAATARPAPGRSSIEVGEGDKSGQGKKTL